MRIKIMNETYRFAVELDGDELATFITLIKLGGNIPRHEALSKERSAKVKKMAANIIEELTPS